MSNCWSSGNCWHGGYGPGMSAGYYLKHIPAVKWLVDPDYYKYSPDHGWAKISKRPIVRQGLGYQAYWPQHWYGTTQHAAQMANSVRYPTVANPTDTMQLGYYYQQVPRWQPMPQMLPAAPVPSKYHIRNCWISDDGGHNIWTALTRGHMRAMKQDPNVKVDANGNRYYDVWVPLNKMKKGDQGNVPAPAPADPPAAPPVAPPAPAPAPAAQPPAPANPPAPAKQNTASFFEKFNPKYILTGATGK